MKFANAAIGLAAMAGFLVVRALKARRAGETAYVGVGREPPEPNQLIGAPMSNLSAREAAETLRGSPASRM